MVSTTQKFKQLVLKHGIKDVSESIDILIKQQQPGYIAESIIPAITAVFNITKNTLLNSNISDHKNIRKLLIFLMKDYLNVPSADISKHFNINRRTVRRYITFVKKILYVTEKDMDYSVYKTFILNAEKVINHIENKKYVNRKNT